MTALLAETTITVADLRSLEVGDLIMTEKPASSPVTVHVGEVPKFLAQLGRHKGNRAVKIVRPIGPTDRV
jgi:flagellar motor switch protein FliM